jgi:hypothetical protein
MSIKLSPRRKYKTKLDMLKFSHDTKNQFRNEKIKKKKIN